MLRFATLLNVQSQFSSVMVLLPRKSGVIKLAVNPIGTKIYLQPEGMVFGTINDLIEMQGATATLSDSGQGQICYSVSLYGSKRDYRFFINNLERKRCAVRLEIEGQEPDNEIMIQRQFALLDAMLTITAEKVYEEQAERNRD